jgi:NTE family protein
MKALVLGGGSVRGAYQAGAIKAILESGYRPKLITSISVGSINGMFLTNLVGREKLLHPNAAIDFEKIGEELWDLWLKEIKKPSHIIRKRKFFELAWALMRHKFDGFADNKPLKKLVEKYIQDRYIEASPIDIYSGTVDLDLGKIVYANKRYPEYIQYAVASSAIPLAMPPSIIRNKPFADGGLIDSAPLAMAFKEEADEIICVANSPESLGAANINTGRPIQYMERCLDIMLNNSLNNDIREAELINKIAPEDGSYIRSGQHEGKRYVPMTIIRPDTSIEVDVMDFDTYDILNMLELGYNNAKKELNLNQ